MIDIEEYCPVCKSKMELRFMGKDRHIFYCKVCLKHRISDPVKEGEEVEQNVGKRHRTNRG